MCRKKFIREAFNGRCNLSALWRADFFQKWKYLHMLEVWLHNDGASFGGKRRERKKVPKLQTLHAV